MLRSAAGLRDVLTHEHVSVDDESVFATARSDVPELRVRCAELLEQTGEID